MSVIVNLDKAKAKVLKWATKACYKDDARPILQAMNFNGRVEACDGYRAHAANMVLNSDEVVLNGAYLVPKTVGVGLHVLEPVGGNYPDIASIVPHTEPVYSIKINAKYLVDALSSMDDYVELRFYANPENKEARYKMPPPMEVFGIIADVEAYALIMPMMSNTDTSTWKPEKIKLEKESENAA